MSEYHVPCPAAPCKSLLLLSEVDKHLAQRHPRALENKRVSFVAYHVPTGRQFHRRISLGKMWHGGAGQERRVNFSGHPRVRAALWRIALHVDALKAIGRACRAAFTGTPEEARRAADEARRASDAADAASAAPMRAPKDKQ